MEKSTSSLFSEFMEKAKLTWKAQEKEVVVPQNEIKESEPLGEGSIKRVVKAKWNSIDVALVKFNGIIGKSAFTDAQLRTVNYEIRIMKALGSNHPNIVRLLGVTDQFNLILELCSGDLFQFVTKDMSLGMQDRFRIALEFVNSITFLHFLGYAHNDLKPQNILISKEKSPKLCDFGSVKAIYASSTSGMSNSKRAVTGGTFGFLGPEISEVDNSKTFDHRMNDVYAVGGVLIFLFSGRLPFQSLTESS
jgi:serine/threonine protein kinase